MVGFKNGKARPEERAAHAEYCKNKKNTATKSGKIESHLKNLQGMGCRSAQMENKLMGTGIEIPQSHQQMPNETIYMNHRQQYEQLDLGFGAFSQLLRISEVLQNESIDYSGDLPTSFVSAEMEIARCISGCLRDVPSQKCDTDQILSLLRDYKVVRFLPGGNPTVSLQQVHLILQDNYKDSLLCGLLNMLLAGFMNTETKVITF